MIFFWIILLLAVVGGVVEFKHSSPSKHHSHKQPRDSKTKRFVKNPIVFINDEWKESL